MKKKKHTNNPFDMSIKSKQSFPTVGEITQFILKGTGLWDRDIEDKKNLQKKIQRFKNEEIILSREEINYIFEKQLRNIFEDEQVIGILADNIVGFIYGYPLLIKENASHLDRKGTGLWVLKVSLPTPLTIYLYQLVKLFEHPSVSKYFNGISPEIPLFLPDLVENKWVYPCQKVLDWWFKEVLGISPEKLIYKEESSGVLYGGKNPEPRTIRSWKEGAATPSMSTILDLTKHFEQNLGVNTSFLLVMMAARLSEFFFRELNRSYNRDEVKSVINEFKVLTQSFKQTLEPKLQIVFKGAEVLPWNMWKKAVNEVYEKMLFHSLILDINQVEENTSSSEKDFFALSLERYQMNMKGTPFPKDKINFSEKTRLLLNECCKTKLNSEEIKALEEIVTITEKDSPKDGTLSFYIQVTRGRLEVFKNNFPRALSFYKEAFDKGRYSAGKFRERIVKELMGLCAYQYTVLYDSKEQRGEYYKVLKYLKEWSSLHYLCEEYFSEDDREFIELHRRNFQKVFRNYLPNIESLPISTGEWDSIAGPETNEKMKNWKPDFRHPSRLVKDFETRDNSQLMVAIYLHRKDDALKLIDRGANLNHFNTTNDNAFNYAVCNNYYDIASKILEGNINKEVLETPTKKYGNTGLGLAIKHRKRDLVKKILEIGVDPNKRLPELDGEMPPLYLAIASYGEPPWKINLTESQLEEVLRRIKSPYYGADNEGRRLEIFKIVAEYYKNIYGSDEESFEIIKILLEAGAVLDLPNTNQHSALTFACELGLKDVVELLLKHKVDPNHQINTGATALMFAVEKDFTEIAELLLKKGADPTITRYDGAMPYYFCKSENMQALIIEGTRNYKPGKDIIVKTAKA